MDVSNPEEHLSRFVLEARAAHDHGDGLGGGLPATAATPESQLIARSEIDAVRWAIEDCRSFSGGHVAV